MNQPNDISPPEPLSLRDIAVLLVKHYGLREGLWDLNLELQVGIGSFGPTREKALPGAMFGVGRIGLTRTPKENAGPNTVNAAELNPAQGS
jgi:hypothetical protein